MRVFLIEEPKRDLDYSSAEKYGEIVVLLKGRHVTPFEVDQFAAEVLLALRQHQYNPNNGDKICVVGSLIPLFIAALVLSEFDRVNLLLFSAVEGRYEERTYQA